MSAAAAARPASGPAPPDLIDAYRDDGPLARGLGRALGRFMPVGAAALLLAALLPTVALIAAAGGDASDAAAGAALAWAILLGGASRGRPASRRQRWMEPPLVRAVEFVGVIWLAALEGPEAYPAAFALLSVLAFRHYDTVYRLRQVGVTPAPWVNALSGGWEGRLIVVFALLVVGELRTGVFVAAALLGAAFVAESVSSWLRAARSDSVVVDQDDAEEGELA